MSDAPLCDSCGRRRPLRATKRGWLCLECRCTLRAELRPELDRARAAGVAAALRRRWIVLSSCWTNVSQRGS